MLRVNHQHHQEPLLGEGIGTPLGPGLRAVTEQRAKWRAEKTSRDYNLILLFLNVGAMVIVFVMLEMAYVAPLQPDPALTCDGGGSYKREIALPFCLANLGVTLVSWLVLIKYYGRKYEAHCKVSLLPRDPLAAATTSPPPFWRGHMLRGFLCECIMLAIQPSPWFNSIVFELLAMCILCRIYLALRALRDFSKRRTQRDSDAASLRPQLVPPLSWRVCFKLLYQQHPLRCITGIFIYSFLTISYLMHIMERDCNPAFESFANSCWLVITTMTTVGYGDLCPKDPLGRIVASVACIWGIILLALVCLVCTDHLSLNSSESRLLRLLQEREMLRLEGEAAAELIQSIWRAKLPQTRAALAEQAAANLTPAARRRLGLPGGADEAAASASGMANVAGAAGNGAAAGGRANGGRGCRRPSITAGDVLHGDAAAAASASAAAGSSHRRMSLLNKMIKQRQVRQLFALEAEAGADASVHRRLDALERTVAAELKEVRAFNMAQSEAMAALTRQLAELTEATRAAAAARESLSIS